ncbi:PadR family transcriptional regulator [Alloalcanivorax xenomutans]|uniref:PadR family transcriptional regulator n=1 Tax=Alloalcanivorax xenomutans TaxID=1094342 RepID=A0A9Q3ZBN6_9GAMM|nr:PadR family transcriptional regulator [Alloalcanivorax xenomutans]ERS10392.1 PadR family transcriptional regulator [Alcanivorax sp. PN-3]KYZ87722.1 PadR family transcriptional regulator [Alcanivorax sp. KX64203]MBA4720529.1 PadR family transcriptional regulator [Alcanivorax sp.]ARB46374.1 PadR family transcriptional regulator [Alloalcanivorax xenomutans]MCE7507808.1 PadR family transcriptional regulator [Alloalcanivorax xenomutans]
MSLRHAILVLLQDEEASGYDLAREFANSIGLVWNATHQQIYLELGKLNEQNMVHYRHVPQDGKPDKKLYRITDEGRQELVRWLRRPAAPARVRDAFMVKVAGGALADPETLLGELDQLVQQRKERLANFEAEARKLERQSEGNSRFQHLTLRRGILDQEAWLSWAEEVREVLEDALSHQH